MVDKMVIMSAWFSKFWDVCDEKQKKEICYGIIKYGLFGDEYVPDDGIAEIALSFIYPQITNMRNGYEKMVEKGKRGGRRPNERNAEIWKLARDGKKVSEIARLLDMPEKTVYRSPGWKMRNEEAYLSEPQEDKKFEF